MIKPTYLIGEGYDVNPWFTLTRISTGPDGKAQVTVLGKYPTKRGAITAKQHASRREREASEAKTLERLFVEEITLERAFKKDQGQRVPKFW